MRNWHRRPFLNRLQSTSPIADSEDSTKKLEVVPDVVLVSSKTEDDEETYVQANIPDAPPRKPSEQAMRSRLFRLELDVARTRKLLSEEKAAKRKLFESLVKLARELKRMRAEALPLMNAADYANQTWYEGGIWRAPKPLPSIGEHSNRALLRQPVGLSDLFVSLLVILALSATGQAVAKKGTVTIEALLYFAVFYKIWTKELNYKTRFDSTDLSMQGINLLTSIALLFGSTSVFSPMSSAGGTRVMAVAAFVAALHVLMHLRLWFGSSEENVRSYAVLFAVMALLETTVWLVGILAFPQDCEYRWAFFVVGIMLSIRIPQSFLPNDFNGEVMKRTWRCLTVGSLTTFAIGESTKRGVFYVILLVVVMHNIVFSVNDYFQTETLGLLAYVYFGCIGFLLFGLKLMYVDDFPTLAQDHALLVNRTSAYLYQQGQFVLILATTAMGAGLTLLTSSFILQEPRISTVTKRLVCWGFAAIIFAIYFTKSLHLQRVPSEKDKRTSFYITYVGQSLVLWCIMAVAVLMPLRGLNLGFMVREEVRLVASLCGMELILLLVSWIDEIIEVAFFATPEDSRSSMVEPFGIWWFQPRTALEKPDVEELLQEKGEDKESTENKPLLGDIPNPKYDGSRLEPIV